MKRSGPWLQEFFSSALQRPPKILSLNGCYVQAVTSLSARREIVLYDGKHSVNAVLTPSAVTLLDEDEDDMGVTSRNLLGYILAPVEAVVLPDMSQNPPRAKLLLKKTRLFSDQQRNRPVGELLNVDREPAVLDALRAAVGRKLASFATLSTIEKQDKIAQERLSDDPTDEINGFLEGLVDVTSFPPSKLLDNAAPFSANPPPHQPEAAGNSNPTSANPKDVPLPDTAGAAEKGAGPSDAKAAAVERSSSPIDVDANSGDESPIQVLSVVPTPSPSTENGSNAPEIPKETGPQSAPQDDDVEMIDLNSPDAPAKTPTVTGKQTQNPDWEISFGNQDDPADPSDNMNDDQADQDADSDALPQTQHFPCDDEDDESTGDDEPRASPIVCASSTPSGKPVVSDGDAALADEAKKVDAEDNPQPVEMKATEVGPTSEAKEIGTEGNPQATKANAADEPDKRPPDGTGPNSALKEVAVEKTTPGAWKVGLQGKVPKDNDKGGKDSPEKGTEEVRGTDFSVQNADTNAGGEVDISESGASKVNIASGQAEPTMASTDAPLGEPSTNKGENKSGSNKTAEKVVVPDVSGGDLDAGKEVVDKEAAEKQKTISADEDGDVTNITPEEKRDCPVISDEQEPTTPSRTEDVSNVIAPKDRSEGQTCAEGLQPSSGQKDSNMKRSGAELALGSVQGGDDSKQQKRVEKDVSVSTVPRHGSGSLLLANAEAENGKAPPDAVHHDESPQEGIAQKYVSAERATSPGAAVGNGSADSPKPETSSHGQEKDLVLEGHISEKRLVVDSVQPDDASMQVSEPEAVATGSTVPADSARMEGLSGEEAMEVTKLPGKVEDEGKLLNAGSGEERSPVENIGLSGDGGQASTHGGKPPSVVHEAMDVSVEDEAVEAIAVRTDEPKASVVRLAEVAKAGNETDIVQKTDEGTIENRRGPSIDLPKALETPAAPDLPVAKKRRLESPIAGGEEKKLDSEQGSRPTDRDVMPAATDGSPAPELLKETKALGVSAAHSTSVPEGLKSSKAVSGEASKPKDVTTKITGSVKSIVRGIKTRSSVGNTLRLETAADSVLEDTIVPTTPRGRASRSSATKSSTPSTQTPDRRGKKRKAAALIQNDKVREKQSSDSGSSSKAAKAMQKLRAELNLLRRFRQKRDRNPDGFCLLPDSFLPG